MNNRLSKLLKKWALRDWEAEKEVFLDHSSIQYLGRKVFYDYEPSQFDLFEDRLDRWLHNVSDDKDQQTLFLLLGRLFFIGRPEFESLCRTAYNGYVLRWLIEQLNADIVDPAVMEALDVGISETWFCPITDSMRINSFLKANKLTGKTHRPDWRSLRKFGDPAKIRQFINDNQIRRVVLLEDFVGSGTQMLSAIKFAADISSDIEILVLPLVICPAGDQVGRSLAATLGNVTYEAVIVIAPEMLIKADVQFGEPPFYQTIRDLIVRVRPRLNIPDADAESRRYHGYKGTGAVVAMYSNCPDNSLPVIYDETEDWYALFPRVRRV